MLTAGKQGTLLLDVRTPEEFEHGHVPGALSFPIENLEATLLLEGETISHDRPVYLICHTQNRSRKAAESFIAAGYTRVFFVLGGTAGWIDAGLPVARGGPKTPRPSRSLPADRATT
jgi:rhodanese-related sulfurtransferase